MSELKVTLRAMCVVVSIAVLSGSTLLAQSVGGYEYVVKFVCGTRTTPVNAQDWNAVSPGRYFTAVNVYNPGNDSVSIGTSMAATAAQPVGGAVWTGPMLSLMPRQALEIDCSELMRQPHAIVRFLKGFVTLRSPRPLEVVVVYTAMNGPGTNSIDVERIAERVPAGRLCPDLTVAPYNAPAVDAATGRTLVYVAVTNVGTIDAPNVGVYAEDPSNQTANRIQTTTIPLVQAGQTVQVTLSFPYVIPVAAQSAIMLIVDQKGFIKECREDNNRRTVGP